eukprot:Skav211375  [mRNA]  locus=scaffold2406:71636:77159:+ [translate_table: standard]
MQGVALHDLQPFLQDCTSRTAQTTWPWFWMLFHGSYPVNWDAQMLELPAGPSTTPSLKIFPESLREEPPLAETVFEIDVRVCSYNVLSLRENSRSRNGDPSADGIGGPALRELLLQQLDTLQILIAGFQETRIKNTHWSHDERYFLFKGAASRRGQGGILAAFSRSRPYGFQKSADDDHLDVEDHRPTCVWFRRPVIHRAAPRPLRPLRPAPRDLEHFEPPTQGYVEDWSLDVSTHAWSLDRQLSTQLQRCPKLPKRAPRKLSMSAPTWDLVCTKRDLRLHLRELWHQRDKVIAHLDADYQSDDFLRHLQALPSLLERLGAPPGIRRLFRNVHSSTWCTLDRTKLFQTCKGTRPGSPIADAIWHALTHEVMTNIVERLRQWPDFMAFYHEFDIDLVTVIWADDIAIPVFSRDGTLLVGLVRELTCLVAEVFYKYGLPLNTECGKTRQFSPDPLARPSTTKDYRCDCGKTFTTGQGLACHKRLVHGIHAPERAFTSQATCQHCLRFFWTTCRLHQHLSYVPRSGKPNPCFAALQAANAVVPYEAVNLPPSLKGHCRFDALQCEGPTVPLVPWQHREIEEVQHGIALIEEQLRFEVPPDHLAPGARLGDALAALTRSWFQGGSAQATFRERRALLGDAWTSFLAEYDETFQEWVGFLFLEWGYHYLPDLVAELIDGEAEQVIYDEFYDIAQGLPRVHLEQRLGRLQGRLRLLQAAQPPAVPHRPIYWGPANDGERHRQLSIVPRLLREQRLWQTELRKASPVFLLVHLFAGRRRRADFHDYVLQFAEQWGIPVCVLSLDTAIAPYLGDLRASSETWLRLLDAFDNQLISGTLLGSPCETFSQARYNPPPDDGSATKKWPRPLRDALNIFGLDRLTLREYKQAAQGHDFVLQGLRTLAAHISGGGLFCSEHPAIPEDKAKASIWTMALTELLRAHPDAQLLTFAQFRWGAETVKPTCLLAYNAPKAKQHLYKHADLDLPVPQQVAIGKNDSNNFCTAALKEYPPRLCAGLAEIFIQRLRQAWIHGNTVTRHIPAGSVLAHWIQDVKNANRHYGRTWLPDYQAL